MSCPLEKLKDNPDLKMAQAIDGRVFAVESRLNIVSHGVVDFGGDHLTINSGNSELIVPQHLALLALQGEFDLAYYAPTI